jgi:penicillin-binding protein 1C
LLEIRAQNVDDGAVLVVDNKNGEVLAYVGGAGDLSSAAYLDGVRASRQPGSTLKPFLYGLAFERRFLTPASLLEDTPVDVTTPGGLYRPRDYDQQFRGLVSVRTALASSLNVPAVRTIGLVGFEEFAQTLREFGFESVNEPGDFYGPSLALGSVDVTLWEAVNAYRALANGGVWSPLEMTFQPHATTVARRVFSEQTAFLISSILSDRQSRSTTFGLENVLSTRFWTAVKTGTSKDMRDNWCIGYSRDFTVGVWVGNFSGAPMRDVSGIAGAAPVWLEVTAELNRKHSDQTAAPPEGIISRKVKFSFGHEPQRSEWFLKGTEPRESGPLIARSSATILNPAAGTIFALDPDIPGSRQKVMLQAASGDGLRWVLDNREDLGPAATMVLWRPRLGKHVLALVDKQNHSRSVTSFEVRGGGYATQ